MWLPLWAEATKWAHSLPLPSSVFFLFLTPLGVPCRWGLRLAAAPSRRQQRSPVTSHAGGAVLTPVHGRRLSAWRGRARGCRAAPRTEPWTWGRETPRGPATVGTTFSPFVKAGSACRIRSSFGSQGFVKFEFPFRTIIYPSVHEYSVETNMSAILIWILNFLSIIRFHIQDLILLSKIYDDLEHEVSRIQSLIHFLFAYDSYLKNDR